MVSVCRKKSLCASLLYISYPSHPTIQTGSIGHPVTDPLLPHVVDNFHFPVDLLTLLCVWIHVSASTLHNNELADIEGATAYQNPSLRKKTHRCTAHILLSCMCATTLLAVRSNDISLQSFMGTHHLHCLDHATPTYKALRANIWCRF